MNKIALVIPILSLFLGACSSLYMPNVPNTPMLSSAGELNASGHVSLRGNVSLNSAYAVSDNFGVILNGAFINRDQRKKDFSQTLLEMGGGYFTTFGPENNRIFEIYGGIGRGESERIYNREASNGSPLIERQEMVFSKGFIQVNYSSKKQNDLRLFGKTFPLNYGTAIRGSYLNAKKFKIDNITQPLEDNIFIEPVFFTRMKVSDAFQLQYTTGSNFGLKRRKYLSAANSVFSLGFVINVGQLKK